jgi:hypothetical protein
MYRFVARGTGDSEVPPSERITGGWLTAQHLDPVDYRPRVLDLADGASARSFPAEL